MAGKILKTEVDCVINRIIKEINVCLNNNCYLTALNTALTLPDICGKAEYPQIKSNKMRYTNWYNTHIAQYEKSNKHPEMFYLTGEMVWSLRNNTLHEGTFVFNGNKIGFEDYELVIQNPNRSVLFGGSVVEETKFTHATTPSTPATFIKKFASISMLNLIFQICACAKAYYQTNAEKFTFLQNKIVVIDAQTKNTFKIQGLKGYCQSYPLNNSQIAFLWNRAYEEE